MELSTIAMLLSLLVVMFLVNIVLQRELARQSKFQEQEDLRGEVKQFRLYKMLNFLGVDYEKYFQKLTRQEIGKHIERCDSCPNTQACDSHLRDGKPVTNMNFCPNYKSLIRHSCTTLSDEQH